MTTPWSSQLWTAQTPSTLFDAAPSRVLQSQPPKGTPLSPLGIQHQLPCVPVSTEIEDIRLGILGLPEGTSGVMSGWTCDRIRNLAESDTRLQDVTRSIFNLILSEHGGSVTP